MEDKTLSLSFEKSLDSNMFDDIGEIADLGINLLMDNEILKNIPFVSTTMRIYHIGKTVHDRIYISKLIAFLNEINNGIADENERKKYQEKFKCNENFRNKELEYILILIDRYIDCKKPKMLSKLYLAYLDEQIDWQDFLTYAEVIDRLLIRDYELFISDKETFTVRVEIEEDSILRLESLGLLADVSNAKRYNNVENGFYRTTWNDLEKIPIERVFQRTNFGKILLDVLSI